MNWIEELLPPFFFPLWVFKWRLSCTLSAGLWFLAISVSSSQEAGGAPIEETMPRAKDPKDICRPTVAGVPCHALHWFTCKINFSGGSPNHTPASPGFQEVKYLDQRSQAAGFEKKKSSQQMKNKRENLLGFSGIHTGFSLVQVFLFHNSPLSNFLRAHSNEPSHHSSYELPKWPSSSVCMFLSLILLLK